MVEGLRLRSLFLKSQIDLANEKYAAIAKEAIDLGTDLAEEIMARERAALENHGLGGLFNDEIMLNIELQFLWGVFHELVLAYPDLPTNGFDRIKVHLIQRLIGNHGYSFEAARDEANAIEGLYNEADSLFDTISGLGKEAFHDPHVRHLPTIVRCLHETGMSDHAYN